MRLSGVSLALVCSLVLTLAVRTARAECNCLAVAGDVAASVQADVAHADSLYARGDFAAALALYARAYASSKDSALVYAQAMAQLQLGAEAKARVLFEQYVALGGVYKERAQARLGLVAGATNAVSATAGAGAGALGGLTGDVRRTGGDVGGAAVATGGAAVGTGVAVAGSVRGKVDSKARIGRGAGIVLGVIAVAALGALAIHGIAAGVSSDISLDPKFDIGMGLAGVSVGISAIYVGGLTAATGAAAGAPCLTSQASNARPIGLAAGFTF